MTRQVEGEVLAVVVRGLSAAAGRLPWAGVFGGWAEWGYPCPGGVRFSVWGSPVGLPGAGPLAGCRGLVVVQAVGGWRSVVVGPLAADGACAVSDRRCGGAESVHG